MTSQQRSVTISSSVDLVLDALSKILAPQADGTSRNLIVHQFGTNLLYLPVYELLHDVAFAWATQFPKSALTIEFISHGKDDEACKKVMAVDGWTSTTPTTLTIGVSEVSEEIREQGGLLEAPFIKRLPLWGVSLVNNLRINCFKRNSLNLAGGAESKSVLKEREARFQYWKVFSGKLSLLQADDLTNADVRLSVSLYPKGTTARRLFDQFLEKRGKIDFTADVKDIKNEFDDLFRGIVDIALTVQPWEAIRQAISQHGHEVEIVYVHQGKPAPFSSVYARKPAHDKWWDQEMLEVGLKAISLGLQEKIAHLYELNSNKELDKHIDVYRRVKNENCFTSASIGQQAESDVTDRENMECALHVISDSRIYYFDMQNISKDAVQIVRDTKRDLDRANNDKNYFTGGEVFDPCNEISRHVAGSDDLLNHPPAKLLCNLTGKDAAAVQAIQQIAKLCSLPIDTNWTCKELSEKWRSAKVCELLPNVVHSATVKPVDFPWLKTYRIWGARDKLIEALSHFDCEFKDKLDATKVCAGVIENVVGDSLGYPWIWIEYNAPHPETTEVSLEDIALNHFGNDEMNIYGRYLLNCYIIMNSSGVITSKQLFRKDGHPHVTISENGAIKLGDCAVTYTMELPAGFSLKAVKTECAIGAFYGLLLTFAVHKQVHKKVVG